MNSLGRVAIVTGAGSGVGRASALALLRDGYSVALAGRRIETLEASLAEAEEHRERAIAVTTDVGSPDSVAQLFARTSEAFGGRLDVLSEPRHGKIWRISHEGDELFEGVPSPSRFGAYHSLVAVAGEIPGALEVVARNETGLAMAVRHRELPIAAVQFHPESILSMEADVGHKIVENAMRLLTENRPAA